MKKIFLILVVLSTKVFALDIPPNPGTYVADFGAAFSQREKQRIEETLGSIDRELFQMIVVTVPSLQGEDPNQFATELGQSWGLRTDTKDNGVILLFTTKQGKGNNDVVIATGYDAEAYLTDSRAGRMLDDYWHGDLANDTISIIRAVNNTISAAYKSEIQTAEKNANPASAEEQKKKTEGIILFCFIAFLVVFVCIILYNVFKKKEEDRMEEFRHRFIPVPPGGGGGSRSYTSPPRPPTASRPSSTPSYRPSSTPSYKPSSTPSYKPPTPTFRPGGGFGGGGASRKF